VVIGWVFKMAFFSVFLAFRAYCTIIYHKRQEEKYEFYQNMWIIFADFFRAF
jgi:hypothetical protein